MDEWTPGLLKEHFEALMAEQDRRYMLRFTEKDLRDQQRFDGQEKAVDGALAKANDKLEEMNEFRGAQRDVIETRIARTEVQAIAGAITDRQDRFEADTRKTLDELRGQDRETKGRSGGINAGWGYLVAAITIAGVLVAIVVALNGAHP